MSVEENRDLAGRFVETIFNEKQTDQLDRFMEPDVVLHHSSRTIVPGLDGIKAHHAGIFAGLPDLHYEVEDSIAEGDRVVQRLTISGTHLGEYWGFAPSGKRVAMTSIHVLRIRAGKIVELWSETDAAGMRAQLEANR
jgi:predicted ester cyclase